MSEKTKEYLNSADTSLNQDVESENLMFAALDKEVHALEQEFLPLQRVENVTCSDESMCPSPVDGKFPRSIQIVAGSKAVLWEETPSSQGKKSILTQIDIATVLPATTTSGSARINIKLPTSKLMDQAGNAVKEYVYSLRISKENNVITQVEFLPPLFQLNSTDVRLPTGDWQFSELDQKNPDMLHIGYFTPGGSPETPSFVESWDLRRPEFLPLRRPGGAVSLYFTNSVDHAIYSAHLTHLDNGRLSLHVVPGVDRATQIQNDRAQQTAPTVTQPQVQPEIEKVPVQYTKVSIVNEQRKSQKIGSSVFVFRNDQQQTISLADQKHALQRNGGVLRYPANGENSTTVVRTLEGSLVSITIQTQPQKSVTIEFIDPAKTLTAISPVIGTGAGLTGERKVTSTLSDLYNAKVTVSTPQGEFLWLLSQEEFMRLRAHVGTVVREEKGKDGKVYAFTLVAIAGKLVVTASVTAISYDAQGRKLINGVPEGATGYTTIDQGHTWRVNEKENYYLRGFQKKPTYTGTQQFTPKQKKFFDDLYVTGDAGLLNLNHPTGALDKGWKFALRGKDRFVDSKYGVINFMNTKQRKKINATTWQLYADGQWETHLVLEPRVDSTGASLGWFFRVEVKRLPDDANLPNVRSVGEIVSDAAEAIQNGAMDAWTWIIDVMPDKINRPQRLVDLWNNTIGKLGEILNTDEYDEKQKFIEMAELQRLKMLWPVSAKGLSRPHENPLVADSTTGDIQSFAYSADHGWRILQEPNPDQIYFHEGIDIGRVGEPVMAALAGKVLGVNNNGNDSSLSILHPSQVTMGGKRVYLKTVYRHITPSTVSVGQSVDRGRQIATVAPGENHLHFEVVACDRNGNTLPGFTYTMPELPDKVAPKAFTDQDEARRKNGIYIKQKSDTNASLDPAWFFDESLSGLKPTTFGKLPDDFKNVSGVDISKMKLSPEQLQNIDLVMRTHGVFQKYMINENKKADQDAVRIVSPGVALAIFALETTYGVGSPNWFQITGNDTKGELGAAAASGVDTQQYPGKLLNNKVSKNASDYMGTTIYNDHYKATYLGLTVMYTKARNAIQGERADFSPYKNSVTLKGIIPQTIQLLKKRGLHTPSERTLEKLVDEIFRNADNLVKLEMFARYNANKAHLNGSPHPHFIEYALAAMYLSGVLETESERGVTPAPTAPVQPTPVPQPPTTPEVSENKTSPFTSTEYQAILGASGMPKLPATIIMGAETATHYAATAETISSTPIKVKIGYKKIGINDTFYLVSEKEPYVVDLQPSKFDYTNHTYKEEFIIGGNSFAVSYKIVPVGPVKALKIRIVRTN